MSLQTELDAVNQYKVNLVVGIGDTPTYFSKRAVDSGLTVDANKIGLIHDVKVNPTSVNLTRIRSSINSTTVTIYDGLEEAQVFTVFMGTDANALIGQSIKVYIGLNTSGGFAFADYVLLNAYVIRSIAKSGASYKIRATSLTFDWARPFFSTKATLNTAINDTDTTWLVDTATDIFQTAATTGRLRISGGDSTEFVQYTGKSFAASITTFTGVARADLSSTAAAFAIGASIDEVKKLRDDPITLYLQLLLSGSGAVGAGAAYDVLHDGLAVDEDDIDIAAIEQIRTDFYSGDTFTLYLYDIENALKYLETRFFTPNQLRPIETSGGKISLAILDQVASGASLPELNTDNTLPNPGWKTTKDNIINQFDIKWAWSEGLKTHTKITTFIDTDSQTSFGIQIGKTLEIDAAQAADAGQGLVNDRGARLLARFSTPQTTITAKSFLKTYANDVGSDVLFTHSDVPAPGGGGLGISEALEILTRAINLTTGIVSNTLVFTSYANIRTGVLCPSPLIATVNSQLSFDVADGTCYKAGYAIRMDDALGAPLADGNRIIDTVVGNTITVTVAFVTTLLTTFRVRFANYDAPWSAEQRGQFAAVGDNSGTFSNDSSEIYKIAI